MAARRRHYPLPKRFSAALSEDAHARLRELSAQYGLSNNYLLTVLLESLDDLTDEATLERVFRAFVDEYCGPAERTN